MRHHMYDKRRFAGALLLAGALGVTPVLAGCAAEPSVPSAEGFQDKLIEGGVTDAEYRLAVEAARSCVEAEGWETTEIALGVDGFTLSFGVLGKAGPSADEAAKKAESIEVNKIRNDCVGKYLMFVERKYRSGMALTGAARDAEMALLIECLDEIGVTGVLTTDDSYQVMGKISAQLGVEGVGPGLDCLSKHERVFPERFSEGP